MHCCAPLLESDMHFRDGLNCRVLSAAVGEMIEGAEHATRLNVVSAAVHPYRHKRPGSFFFRTGR